MLSLTTLACVRSLIERRHLHSILPVSLTPLLDEHGIALYYRHLPDGMRGFIYPGRYRPIMVIDPALDENYRRATIAHEIGHRLARHKNCIHVLEQNHWLYSKLEQEADAAAAMLLVPLPGPDAEGVTVEDWAATCIVPAWLARIRLELEPLIRNREGGVGGYHEA